MSHLSEALGRARAMADQPVVATNNAVQPERPSDTPPGWRFQVACDAPPVLEELEREPDSPTGATRRSVDGWEEKLVTSGDLQASVVEQYRRLAAALHHAQRTNGMKCVMIASALPAEGKTLTAANLALTLSGSYGRRVLLVDADLRHPGVHELFLLDNQIGLRDTLRNDVPDRQLPVHRVTPSLWAITAGRPDPDPMSGFVSGTIRQFLMDAAEQFDWVLLDTPPVTLLSDGNLLADCVDAALLIVNANTTGYPAVKRAIAAVGAARILGVVLNRAEPLDRAYHYQLYEQYVGRRRRTFPHRLLRIRKGTIHRC